VAAEFGKGYDARNLRYMGEFYRIFPIWNALRSELSWTHYLLLCADRNEAAVCYAVAKCSRQVCAARYLLHLPSEEELRQELEIELAGLMQGNEEE
jgi:hypothetical protein